MWTRHRRSRPSPSGSRCSSRSVVVSGPFHLGTSAGHADAPVHVPRAGRARARPGVAGGLRGASGRTTRRGSCARARPRGRRTPRACGCSARTCPSCARVRARGRARGRWRPRGADALALQAAALPRRVLAGRVDARRRADARAQLRLRALAVRRGGLVDRTWSQARDRDERLPLGAARRDERGRARGVAHVRRPPRARRRVRDPDRHALPARDVRHRRGDEGRVGAAAVFAQPQPDGGGCGRRRASPRTSRPTASRSSGRSRSATNHQGIVEWPEQAQGDPHDRAGADGRSRCSTIRRSMRERSPRASCARRCSRRPTRTGSERCTRPRTVPPRGSFGSIWPTQVWELGFERFEAGEHTEVLAEPTFATSAG